MDPHASFQGLIVDQALAIATLVALVSGIFGAIYWWVAPLFSLLLSEGEEEKKGDKESPYHPPSASLE